MAKFRIYNIQLLPNGLAQGEVGVKGYKKLFQHFRENTRNARLSKKLGVYHRRVGREGYFGPMEFHVKSGFVWGHFVRYTKTDQVEDLYTRRRLYTGSVGNLGVSSIKEILFLFDCKQHFFAIEEAGNALPPPGELVSMLEHYLHPIAREHFRDHGLHVSLVSDRNSLDLVLERAAAFSRIEVNLSFPNGPAEDTLEQIKKARMQKIQFVGSPGESGSISKKLPEFLLDLIKGAMTYGRTKLTYLVPDRNREGGYKRLMFSSESSPLRFEKRQTGTETDEAFAERCVEELRNVVKDVNLVPEDRESDATEEEEQ